MKTEAQIVTNAPVVAGVRALKKLRVLLVEDNPMDAKLILRELYKAGFELEWQRVETESNYRTLLEPALDLIIADYSLPQFNGLEALSILNEKGWDIPFIIVSGSLGDELAAECIKQGAIDYVLKDRLARIGLAVSRALELKQEIAEHQRATEELRRSQARFFTVFRSCPAAMSINTVFGGRLIDANEQYCKLFGYSREEIIGKSVRDLNLWANPEERDPVMRRLLREGSVRGFQTKQRLRSGEVRDVHASLELIELAGESEPVLISMFIDITERLRAEAELERERTFLVQRVAERTAELSMANARLAEGSKLKDEFLANMSHELRTPLNAILGLSEALLEQISGPLTPRQIKSVTTISTSGNHLLSLINDILDLSKIEAGKLELNPAPVNLDDFCQNCLIFVRTQAMQKHIGVAFENDGRVASVFADAKRLKQILVNLLSNAVKFTPEGGRIGLAVNAPPHEEVVRFTVWDTGIGIAQADASKLFRAFTQIDSGLSRAQEGTGLGLALVAKLVELHGGSVTLESEPDKGSRFTVTLPLLAAPEARGPEQKHSDRRHYRRALVIEDDPTAGTQIARYLTELGLNSVLHGRGLEALNMATREQPDIILLDVLLPDDSGWMVLARLKEHPATRAIPVVIVSVMDEPERSRALGAEAHLTKPVTRQQLAEFLQRPFIENQASAAEPFAKRQMEGPLILLAEDNPANIQTIGGYLEDKGCQMHYSTNGLMAIKFAREIRPSLILMDIQMPVMDGLTAIREIRADTQLKDIPIVALTALAMPGDRERCLAAGATDYICKPVSLRALSELVRRLLPETRKEVAVCP